MTQSQVISILCYMNNKSIEFYFASKQVSFHASTLNPRLTGIQESSGIAASHLFNIYTFLYTNLSRKH